MMSYPIDAARQSGLFDRILVSTESDEVAQVAESCGGEVAFRRPESLADDHAGTDAVFLHGLNWLLDHGESIEYACCIYATVPFLDPEDLHRGLTAIREAKAVSAVSVVAHEKPILRSLRRDERGRLTAMWPEFIPWRSQDLPVLYQDAAQFYWVNVDRYLVEERLFSSDAVPVILPPDRVQDIDTPADWTRAEDMLHQRTRDEITLRRASLEDAPLIWRWRNEPGVREVSFQTDWIPWDHHEAWFRNRLADTQTEIWIVQNDQGLPMGQVRFDLDSEGPVISVVMDAAVRGRGWGSRVIKLATDRYKDAVHAYIKPGNEASVRAFEKAGYKPHGLRDLKGQQALHFKRPPQLERSTLTPPKETSP